MSQRQLPGLTPRVLSEEPFFFSFFFFKAVFVHSVLVFSGESLISRLLVLDHAAVLETPTSLRVSQPHTHAEQKERKISTNLPKEKKQPAPMVSLPDEFSVQQSFFGIHVHAKHSHCHLCSQIFTISSKYHMYTCLKLEGHSKKRGQEM